MPCLTYPNSRYTVSQMRFMHHETYPPFYVHGNCTAVFPLTSTIFLQIQSASFNISDKLPVANCWPVNFSDRSYYLIFSFLSRHTANGAWLLPRVGSYRFNDVELTQPSSFSRECSHVKTAGSSIHFLSLPLWLEYINRCSRRSHYYFITVILSSDCRIIYLLDYQ